jgi:hypothetical protein
MKLNKFKFTPNEKVKAFGCCNHHFVNAFQFFQTDFFEIKSYIKANFPLKQIKNKKILAY